jgi:membrane-bound lytic murein transglycosylase D
MGRHTVERGETVRALASRFGISEKEFMRLNGLKDATKLRAGAVVKYPLALTAAETAEAFAQDGGEPAEAPLPNGWRWHTVERGESLSQVAARYGHDRSSLERANALQPGAAIHEGLKLKIPPPGVTLEPPATDAQRPPEGEDHSVLAYQVQKGDTLEGLAETFATTPGILRTLNRLTPGETLASGRRIVVPNNLFE